MKVIAKNEKGARVQFAFASEDYPKGKSYIFNNLVSGYSDDQLTKFAEALDLLVEGQMMDDITVLTTTCVLVGDGQEQLVAA